MSTRRITDPVSAIRWIEVVNNSSSLTIPSFGLVRIVSVDSAGVLTVDRPNANNQYVLVNGHIPIAPSGRGYATSFDHVHALYETADGTPALGEVWGAEASTYKLAKNNTGFVIAGGVTDGRVTVYRAGATAATAAFSGARVFNSGALTVPNSTLFAVTFDSERFDTDAYHSTSVNTSRLTAPATGYYLIGGSLNYAPNTTGQRCLDIRLNGATFLARTILTPTAAADESQNEVTTLYQLNVTDYVELVACQTSGGDLDIEVNGNYSPEFWITCLGC